MTTQKEAENLFNNVMTALQVGEIEIGEDWKNLGESSKSDFELMVIEIRDSLMKPCEWSLDERKEYIQTDCGYTMGVEHVETLSEAIGKHQKFCRFCGGKIKQS